MRLVVHMGATKTASTYLQKCLALNEELLREHGIYLPKAGRRTTTSNLNHHILAWHLLGDRRLKQSAADWDSLSAELEGVDADIVLLSSEAFARLASDEDMRVMFARRLFELSDDVALVYVVRDPLSRINSMYSQTVKTFADPDSFDDYAVKSIRSGFYDLEQSFQFWYEGNRAEFLALRFDEFVKTGPLPSLLATLGVDVPVDALNIPDDISNQSPGPIAVEAFRLLNAHLRVVDPEFSRRSVATTRLSQIAQRRAGKQGWNDERYWGWDAERAAWAADKLAGSNERFAQRLWGSSWPLGAPISRQRTSVSLIDVPNRTRKDVESYVSAMTKRYLKLLGGGSDSESDDAPLDEIGVDGHDTSRLRRDGNRSGRRR